MVSYVNVSEKLFLGQLPFMIKIQSMLFYWSNRTSADKTYTISIVLCHALSNFYNYINLLSLPNIVTVISCSIFAINQ
jgi:hypothetical protein